MYICMVRSMRLWWFRGLVGLATNLSYLASQAACQSVYLPISDKLTHSIFIVRFLIADNFADLIFSQQTLFHKFWLLKY